jgi:hypothetical protein
MSRVERFSISYHPRAVCEDEACGWEYGSSAVTRDLAKQHVRHTGHSVQVTVETRDRYHLEDS